MREKERKSDKVEGSERPTKTGESDLVTQADSNLASNINTNRNSDMPSSFHRKDGEPMRILAGQTEVLSQSKVKAKYEEP